MPSLQKQRPLYKTGQPRACEMSGDFRVVGGALFGMAVSFINFFLLRKWAMRLGDLNKPSLPFLAALFTRYLLLFSGIFVIVSGKWVDRASGLIGLFGMYVGLLTYQFVKLKKGD